MWISADDVAAGLAANEEYQRGRAEVSERLARQRSEWRAAEAPVVHELRDLFNHVGGEDGRLTVPILVGSNPELYRAKYILRERGVVSRTVRGSRMRSMQNLFDEFCAAFQFPLYFGNNWAAFLDSITDLKEGLDVRSSLVVFIYEPQEVLTDEDNSAMELFVRFLQFARQRMAEVPLDPDAFDIRIVLVAPTTRELEVAFVLWSDAGAVVDRTPELDWTSIIDGL